MKKLLALLLTICFLPLCAGAEAGPLRKSFDALETLLTKTENVTLTIKADFDYDGEPFKRVEGTYIQDEFDSLMDLEVYTASGSAWKESGYRVAVKDWEGYGLQYPMRYGYYTFQPNWKMTPVRPERYAMLFEVGGAAVSLSENTLAPFVTQEDGRVTLSFEAGQAPEGTGVLLKALISLLAQRYMGAGDVGYDTEEEEEDFLRIIYDDYSLCFEKEYKNETGTEIPGDFFEHLWFGENDDLTAIWEKVVSRLSDREAALEEQYPKGVAVIDTDFNVHYYPSEGDYMIARGEENISYDDIAYTLIAWYRERTGEEWTLPLLSAMKYSDNEALRIRYQELVSEMMADYLSRLRGQKKAYGYVYADGSMLTTMDWDDLPYETTARRALSHMDQVRPEDVRIEVTMNESGGITGAKGDVTLTFISQSGKEHILHFTFEASAGDYGTSRVGRVNVYFNEGPSPELPDEVVIDGVTYALKTK